MLQARYQDILGLLFCWVAIKFFAGWRLNRHFSAPRLLLLTARQAGFQESGVTFNNMRWQFIFYIHPPLPVTSLPPSEQIDENFKFLKNKFKSRKENVAGSPSEKSTGLFGSFSQVSAPPLFGRTPSKKKLWFILHFRCQKAFLVFTKKITFGQYSDLYIWE